MFTFPGRDDRTEGDGLLLNIGCGAVVLEGCTNCDLYPGKGVDYVFDACGTWPFEDNSAKGIFSSHTLEHLPDPFAFFREAWRVLMPGGFLQLALPFGGHRSAWWDLTHLRPWFAESFCFLQPGYMNVSRNLQHNGWNCFFDVADIAIRVSARFVRMLKWRIVRYLLMPWLGSFNDTCEELMVYAIALKTQEQVDLWCRTHGSPHAVPARYVVYGHHWDGVPAPTAGPITIKPLTLPFNAQAFFHDWGRSGGQFWKRALPRRWIA